MIWVAGLTGRPDSPSRAIYEAFLRGDLEVVVSSYIVREIEETLIEDLNRPAIEVEAFISLLLARAHYVAVQHQVMGCEDPNDDPFLEAAVKGQATWIVTKDNRLLNLRPFVRQYFSRQHVRTIAPHKFFDMCASSRNQLAAILVYDSENDKTPDVAPKIRAK